MAATGPLAELGAGRDGECASCWPARRRSTRRSARLEQRASASAAEPCRQQQELLRRRRPSSTRGCRRPLGRPGIAKVAFASPGRRPGGARVPAGRGPPHPSRCGVSRVDHRAPDHERSPSWATRSPGQLGHDRAPSGPADRPIRILLAARTGCLGLGRARRSRASRPTTRAPSGRARSCHGCWPWTTCQPGRVQRSPRCGCVHDRADTSRPPRPRASGRPACSGRLRSLRRRRRRHGRRGGSSWAPDGIGARVHRHLDCALRPLRGVPREAAGTEVAADPHSRRAPHLTKVIPLYPLPV